MNINMNILHITLNKTCKCMHKIHVNKNKKNKLNTYTMSTCFT